VTEIERVLRGAYEAFNARDIDAALALMLPEVDWPNAMQGGRVRGRDEVRAYWMRQFQVVDSRVEPQHFFTDEAGRIEVEVRQTVRDMAGNVIADQKVRHVYTFRDGLIERMDIKTA
jgi:ketosteroid isomerase-like protein